MKSIPYLKSIKLRLFTANCLTLLLALLMLASCNDSNNQTANRADQPFRTHSTKDNSDTNKGIEPFTVVNWNIEWLGSTSNGPKNKQAQINNAIKILKYLNADLYSLCEIVDPQTLATLTKALGKKYAYVVSDYGSGAKSSRDPGYLNTQKLAFIYNKDRLKNIKTGGYLQSDPRVGYNFASGRYPFRLTASIQAGNKQKEVDFMIIHAKSGADKSSYERRRQASEALKSALDKDKARTLVMLLGDFNDLVDGSITSGKSSPYQNFIAAPNYLVLTRPLSSERSTLHYSGVIDHQIISSQLSKYYIPGSTKIRTDIISVVPDYKKGGTSDHYPVSSAFNFEAVSPASTKTNNTGSTVLRTAKSQNQEQASNQEVFTAKVSKGSILIHASQKAEGIEFILYNKRGNKVLSVHRKYILKEDNFKLRTPDLYKGDYKLVILSDYGKQQIAFTVK